MKRRVKNKIPKHPDWRLRLLQGELTEEYAQLRRFLDEEDIDVGLGDIEDEEFQTSRLINDTPPMRKIAQRMLIERCSNKVISDVLYHKFDEAISERAVHLYRKFFFDTTVLNRYDLASIVDLPKRPPVPNSMRTDYAAHLEGADVDVDPDMALKVMFTKAFFRAQELGEYGWAGDDKLLKYQRQAMDLYKTMREFRSNTELPEEFQFEIEYPEQTAASFEDLEDYDPNDDPNEEEAES